MVSTTTDAPSGVDMSRSPVNPVHYWYMLIAICIASIFLAPVCVGIAAMIVLWGIRKNLMIIADNMMQLNKKGKL